MPKNDPAAMQAEIDRLTAELSKKNAPKPLSLKVSEKGGLSVYGLGRFPVTLYKEQWLRLITAGPELLKFIEANAASLKAKPTV